MYLAKLTVTREGYYSNYNRPDPSKPFATTIEIVGQNGKVELSLSAELSEKIVAIVAGAVADAGRATAEAMTADAMTIAALPVA